MAIGLFLLSRLNPAQARSRPAWPCWFSTWARLDHAGAGHRRPKRRELRDLGTATSDVTFLRAIDGSLGVAVFGGIFSNVLAGRLNHPLGHVSVSQGLSGTGGVSPAQPAQLTARAADRRALHDFLTGRG